MNRGNLVSQASFILADLRIQYPIKLCVEVEGGYTAIIPEGCMTWTLDKFKNYATDGV